MNLKIGQNKSPKVMQKIKIKNTKMNVQKGQSIQELWSNIKRINIYELMSKKKNHWGKQNRKGKIFENCLHGCEIEPHKIEGMKHD